jgi:GR25 family glycosyltransferase involved in LPS biosynthesis
MVLSWNLIDKVIYINLKDRTDRKKHLEKQLGQLQVPKEKIVRFNAHRHLLGHIGCAQSHLSVLDMAIEQGWSNILILEDDMCFNPSSETREALQYTLTSLASLHWDVALLSANYCRVIPFKSTNRLVKPLHAFCACAYIVNANYFSTLRTNFAESVEHLLQGGAKHRFALDAHWIHVMQRDRWLGMHPVAGHQMAGQSNIENKHMDYTSLFYKEISAISSEVSP